MNRFADSHIHMKDNDDAKVRRMLDLMVSCGVTDSTIHALPYRGVNQNLKALWYKSHYTGLKLRAFGSLHDYGPFSKIAPLDEVKRLIALGCDGVKMMECDPLMRKLAPFGVDNEYYDPMFDWLEENDLPVCMHVADPETFWDAANMTPERIRRGWFYGDGTFPTKQQIYNEVFRMLGKHPKLRVTFAHFFFLSDFPDEAERVLTTYPNVLFDLTPGSEMYPNFAKRPDVWHDFFTRHGDRILFGTDSNTHKGDNDRLNRLVYTTLTHDRTEFPMPCFSKEPIRGLELDDETVGKILYGNYRRFVGETPREVDLDGCREASREMLAILREWDEDKDPTGELLRLSGDPNQSDAAAWLERTVW